MAWHGLSHCIAEQMGDRVGNLIGLQSSGLQEAQSMCSRVGGKREAGPTTGELRVSWNEGKDYLEHTQIATNRRRPPSLEPDTRSRLHACMPTMTRVGQRPSITTALCRLWRGRLSQYVLSMSSCRLYSASMGCISSASCALVRCADSGRCSRKTAAVEDAKRKERYLYLTYIGEVGEIVT